MRHRYSCPLRWADLDMLGHVNNVRYADYLREARDDLLRVAGVDVGSAGLLVRRHELTFRAPLLFGTAPVAVDCWLTALTADCAILEYTVHDGSESPRVYLRARSFVTARAGADRARPFSADELAALTPYLEQGAESASPEPVRIRSDPEGRYALHVRASDLDVTGCAGDVACVEYFQEARISFFEHLLHELPDTARLRWVVAQTELDYVRPIPPSRTPYDCFTRLAAVGNKSLAVDSVIRDADGLDVATVRVVLVVFDPVTQRATEPPPGYREVLEGFVSKD